MNMQGSFVLNWSHALLLKADDILAEYAKHKQPGGVADEAQTSPLFCANI